MEKDYIKEKIEYLIYNNEGVNGVTIEYDTYSLEVFHNNIGVFSIFYKEKPIKTEFDYNDLIKTLERYEFYPKSYFEEVLSKKEEYSKKTKFVEKINDDIEKIKEDISDLNMEIGHYKEVNGGIEDGNYYKINFYRIEDEVNKIKDNYSDLLLNKEND